MASSPPPPDVLSDLSVHLVTWNVVGREPIEDLRQVLGLDDGASRPDVYAVGLQEVSASPQSMLLGAIFEDPWSKAARETLARHDYVRVRSIRLQGLLLLLFVRRRHLTRLRAVQTDYTRTGLRRMWGNKGGVTIRLSVYGCSVCIVNCHLAAHDDEVQQRVEDFNAIIDGQAFASPETENILCHDYIFWMGDLNFRIAELAPHDIVALVEQGRLERLLQMDQLQRVMTSGEAFSEFREPRPSFRPSYKFRIGSNDYDLGRRPSWTDRILYKVNADVYEDVTLHAIAESYNAHSDYVQSDHKPVSARFTIKVFAAPLADGVQFAPVATQQVGRDLHCHYTLLAKTEVSVWDWVGLFRCDFSSLDDYVTYVWAASRYDGTAELKVTFAEVNVQPGPHRVLYISNDFGSVLGISEPFQIAPRP